MIGQGAFIALRMVTLAAAIAVAGCTTMGHGGKSEAPITAANNTATLPTPPKTGFFALLDSEAAGKAAYAAQQQAAMAPTGGVAVPWQAGGESGTATPGPIHVVNTRACRDVVLVTERDQQRVSGRTTMCRQTDGSWAPLGIDR